ncbi:hypothetical protein FACS1894208_00910 [Clostridia bacterium]|nr:hypothetical protein FACS1894208_00910 [Clostridia bacterium]
MVSARLLRCVKDSGAGLSSAEITEWTNALALAVGTGTLRLGDANRKLVNDVSLAWCSKPFTSLSAHEYTHGDRPLRWSNAAQFEPEYCIGLPIGHPVRADYIDGQVAAVSALLSPGDYSIDVTDGLAHIFPAGIDLAVEAVYAVVSSLEPNWSTAAFRVGTLVSGERGFIEGVDRLTLAWVDGCDFQTFMDFGVLGALSLPTISPDTDENSLSRGVIIAVAQDRRCAISDKSVQSGELISVRTISGAGSSDLVYLDLDCGVSVSVPDLLSVRNISEGAEVFCACEGERYLLSDKYGNFLLGCRPDIF